MDLLLASSICCSFQSLQTKPGGCFLSKTLDSRRFSSAVRCMASTKPCEQISVRRSADYQPPIWEYDYLQSISSNFTGNTCTQLANKLKEEVRRILDYEEEKQFNKLELVDTVERLGLSYHFETEINRILENVHKQHCGSNEWKTEDLYAAALKFRLLRQHGYNISQEVFAIFMDKTDKFKTDFRENMEGLLSLYEASYLSIENENILDEARDFSTKHLKESIKKKIDQNLATLVSHALELPLHWRVPRLEARWFIDFYERSPEMNRLLLQFAKLDFNMVQAVHQEDLKFMSRWWRSTKWGEKLSFARDKLVENFLWNVERYPEPKYKYARRTATKINALITTIDDVYDVYGTLDELELFTSIVERLHENMLSVLHLLRCDINALDQLPDYMKTCFLCLYNSVNEMAYDTLKELDFNCIPYLRRAWANLCKTYLVEAKWFYKRYRPTLEEYMDNAWISISTPVMLTHAYFFQNIDGITKEALDCLEKCPDIIRWSAIILRLADDLATSPDEMKRGDVPKSIQCYMHEKGASEEEAREYVRHLIGETWEKMNKERVADHPFSMVFIEAALNLARMAQCIYQHGDGHSAQDSITRARVSSLLIDPIPLDLELRNR